MKKFFLTVICLAAAYAAVEAQEISDKAAYTLNIDRALWYGSGNAAGLARTEASPWRNATAAYGLQSGTFTNSWEARSQTDFGVSGSTLLDLNGFKLAAAGCDIEYSYAFAFHHGEKAVLVFRFADDTKAADVLAAYLKACDELRFSNLEFTHVKQGLEPRLQHLCETLPEVRYFVNTFVKCCWATVDQLTGLDQDTPQKDGNASTRAAAAEQAAVPAHLIEHGGQ